MKVLVIQQKMIGDVLASTTICEAIKTKHPNWEVHYLIYPHCKPVVENNPFIDQILLFDPKKNKGLLSLIAFGSTLQKKQYDLVIDAYGKWESILPTFFSKAPIRIGYKKIYTSLFYTHLVTPEKNKSGSAIHHRLQLAQAIIKDSFRPFYPKIYLSVEEKASAKSAIHNLLDPSASLIMISVLGSEPRKSLPPHQMATTLDRIVSYKNDAQLLFNYMPHQMNEARVIYDLCRPETQQKIIFDFYTQDLRAFLAVLEQCDALIGNEGGAVNMAKALNVKTFTIFSPWIEKKAWHKHDEVHHVAVHLGDYFPALYAGKHPKAFKNKATVLYALLEISYFEEELKAFLAEI